MDFDINESTSLSEFLKGRLGSVIFFFPHAFSITSTIEAKNFRSSYFQFKKAGWGVLGVSTDKKEVLSKFTDELNLNYPLVCDELGLITEEFGVKGNKIMNSRGIRHTLRRTFLVNSELQIIKSFEKVRPGNHSSDILNWLKEDHIFHMDNQRVSEDAQTS